MALDKAVDSSQLDACCAAEANAIRAKTGGSSQIAYDWANSKGFADAIAAIPGGGTDYLQYARRLDGFFFISYSTTYTFPFDTITINAPLVSQLAGFFSTGPFSSASCKNRGVKKIVLNIGSIGGGSGNQNICAGAKDLEEIDFTFVGSDVLDQPRANFTYLQSLKKITGLKFRINGVAWPANSSNNPLYFTTGSVLEEVRFEQGTGSVSIYLGYHGHLSDASLVSLGNGLDGTVTDKSVTLHADCKARLSTIMGTVTDGVFTLDAQGTVNLNDFITTTKGWTVA
ncbi:MAG: hypothetical protein IK149_01775 [Oscillospiraceae bacterium]|nr:hypothetical protein [Oscillospiraceae bacterium]